MNEEHRRLTTMMDKGQNRLIIDLDNLRKSDEGLHKEVLATPAKTIGAFEKALTEMVSAALLWGAGASTACAGRGESRPTALRCAPPSTHLARLRSRTSTQTGCPSTSGDAVTGCALDSRATWAPRTSDRASFPRAC